MTDFGETKRESMLGQLDRYQIKEKLGAGAMAAVFRAFDPHIDREIAIKVLRPELAKDEEHRARFLREARSAGGLSHDNIVQVFDVGESQNHPYMAMELLEGPTLKEIMHEEGALSVEDAINIAIDLARGLDSAHQAGVVHRDIKPGNVVRIASTGRIKITDFGIARQDSISDDDRTRAGTVLGTPRYMSPEQVRADRNIDGRSDLFSLGVILYQMLAGQTPFDGPTEAAVYVRITQEEPEPLNKLQPSLPSSLIKIVAKLLRKDPEQRYQTGAQLAGELKQVQRGLREERRRAHERKVVPLRLKWTAIAGAALALATLVGLWVVQHRQSQEMTALTYEYGSSLANFIARESMQPIQRGLWPAIEVYVEQTNERQDLISLTIIGPDGVVRGSTDAGSIGVGFVEPALPEPSATLGNTVVYEQTADDGRAAFLSVTPIVSRGQDVGEVRLTLPLEQVKSLSRQLTLSLAVLALIIVVIASLIAYFMARHLSAPIATLRESFDKLRNVAMGAERCRAMK